MKTKVTSAVSRTQVAAAVTLLNKILPVLRSLEIKAEGTSTYVIRVPESSENIAGWVRDYAPKTSEAPVPASAPEGHERLS